MKEDEFLKNVFQNYVPEEKVSKGFNQEVIQKISTHQYNIGLIQKFVKIFIPVVIIFLVGMTFLLFSYGNTIFSLLNEVIPLLKPWHLMVVVGLIYFHFVRSILFLAFIYIRKQFNITLFLPSIIR